MARILIIEDEPAVRANLSDLLTEEGFEVDVAADGPRGLQLASDSLPDLILCDIMLPGLDGRGVLNELRRNPRTIATPFVFLTALSDRSTVRQSMNLGADDYLTKPFTRAEVLDVVNSRLTRQSALERLREAELQQAEAKWLLIDSITYLPSRLTLRERFSQFVNNTNHRPQIVPVICVSVDRFDRIPTSLGSAVGDQLLKAVADRLVDCIGRESMITRLRGAMFNLVIPPITHMDELSVLARQISMAFQRPLQLQVQELYLTISQGYALYPRDGSELELLLRNAEAARATVENEGGGSWRVYAPTMIRQSVDQIDLETELYQALERHEFSVYYQPRIDLAANTIVAAEALIRWQHPTRGLLGPGNFIPLAEESGLINQIGTWVFGEVCRQIREWQEQGYPAINVSVNLSRRQLAQPGLAEQLAGLVAQAGIDPHLVELELTESLAMLDLARAQALLLELRRFGMRVAIDDFGTGYSSLSALRTLPIDLLKVDRAFIHDASSDLDASSLVETIIQIAHRLGLRVVAEGVETQAQADLLRMHGCDEIQGFLFSRPIPADEFEHFWRKQLTCE